jgi:hypothetical protein
MIRRDWATILMRRASRAADLPHEAMSNPPRKFNLGGALHEVLGHWRRIAACGALGLVLGAVYLHLATYRYTVTMELASTDQMINPSLADSLSLLRPQVTIGVRLNLNTELFLAHMHSIEVADEIAKDPEMMHAIFRGSWDAETKDWRQPSALNRAVKRVLGYPDIPFEPPSGKDVQTYIEKNVEVRHTATDPVTVLVLKDRDKDFAERLLKTTYLLADNRLRDIAVTGAREKSQYLEANLAKATIEEYRQQLVLALVDQVKILMAGDMPSAFAMYVVSGPTSTKTPTDPRPLFVLTAALGLGVVIGVLTLRRRFAIDTGHAIETGRAGKTAVPMRASRRKPSSVA